MLKADTRGCFAKESNVVKWKWQGIEARDLESSSSSLIDRVILCEPWLWDLEKNADHIHDLTVLLCMELMCMKA